MNFDNVKKRAIDHYNRMIEWVKTQFEEGIPNSYRMLDTIGEIWYSEDCIFCLTYKSCSCCPLATKELECCNGEWLKMADAETWKEWLYHAEKIKVIIENLEQETTDE